MWSIDNMYTKCLKKRTGIGEGNTFICLGTCLVFAFGKKKRDSPVMAFYDLSWEIQFLQIIVYFRGANIARKDH